MFLRLIKWLLLLSFLLVAIEVCIFATLHAGPNKEQRDIGGNDQKKNRASKPVNLCDSNPCQNNGKCTAKRKGYYCACESDYAGTNCEVYMGNKEAFKDETPENSNLENQATESTLFQERTFKVGVIDYGRETLAPEGRFGPEGLQKMRLGYAGKTRITMGATYLGCAEEEPYAGGVLGTHKEVKLMTVEMCVTLCRYKRYTYAGVSNGVNCQCRNYYNPGARVDERQCAHTCGGNRSQICGGTETASVWTTCPMGYYGETCRYRCRCALYQCNIDDGTCPTSACKIGWKGSSCEELDITSFRTQTACWIMIGGYAVLAFFITFTGSFFIVAFKLGNVEWTKGNFNTMLKIVKGQKVEQPTVYRKSNAQEKEDDDMDEDKDKKKGQEKK